MPEKVGQNERKIKKEEKEKDKTSKANVEKTLNWR